MAVTINASTSTGLVQSADTSGIITLQNNGTNAVTVDNGNLQFNSGYGSVATAYGCRAWVNFNGIGTVAIRGSGNVSSVTDAGTGSYIVNLTTAMPDVNYCATSMAQRDNDGSSDNRLTVVSISDVTANNTSSTLRLVVTYANASQVDASWINVAFFR
jgi:hypothetical protein